MCYVKIHNRHPVLVVEDNDEDFEMLKITFRQKKVLNELFRCEDGDEVLDFLRHQGRYGESVMVPRPGLILLDLNLAGSDGRDVLKEIKSDPNLKRIPVVVLSTSYNPKDVQACYEYGANSYAVKPVDIERFERMVDLLNEYWFENMILPDEWEPQVIK